LADGLNIDLRSDVKTEPPEPPGPPKSVPAKILAWFVDVVRSWGPALLIVLVIRSILVEPFQIPSGSMVPTLAIGDFILVSKFSYGLRIPFTNIELLDIGEPKRGDIDVFIYPPTQSKDPLCGIKRFPGRALEFVSGGRYRGPEPCDVDYIKRVVGLPGDTVEVRNDILYITGVEQPRTFETNSSYTDTSCRADDMKQYEETLDGVTHPVLQSTSFARHAADFGPQTVPEGHYFMMGDNRDNSADSRFWGFVPRENIRGKALFVWFSYDQCASETGDSSIRLGRIGKGLK
jgi:signal peptidase I